MPLIATRILHPSPDAAIHLILIHPYYSSPISPSQADESLFLSSSQLTLLPRAVFLNSFSVVFLSFSEAIFAFKAVQRVPKSSIILNLVSGYLSTKVTFWGGAAKLAKQLQRNILKSAKLHTDNIYYSVA